MPARRVVLRVRCLGPLGSCSPVCPLGAFRCVCGVLGHLAPVHRCARSVRCVVCALSGATWPLLTGVRTLCVGWVCGVRGHLASVHQCARSAFCVVCGSCEPVCQLGELCYVCGVLGHRVPVHRCARLVLWDASVVSGATLLVSTDVRARRVVLPAPVHWCACSVRCVACAVSWGLGSCSLVCSVGALCCVCGVLGHLAPVHRCARSVRCDVCAVSGATWLLFTVALAPCVVLRARCPGPLGSCSPVCSLGALRCVCSVLGNLAPVHRCARSARSVACAVSWATWPLFTSVHARGLVLRVRPAGPLGSSSLVCTLGLLCCLCGVRGHRAHVHRCARSACCVACALSWATWLLFTGVLVRRVVMRVRCPRLLGSCSPVCTLGVLC